jgi:hypothetical protein
MPAGLDVGQRPLGARAILPPGTADGFGGGQDGGRRLVEERELRASRGAG